MRDYTPDPRLYEMMTILSPDVAEDDLPAQVETIAGYITTAGGTVNETLRDSPWGRRRLAYSIRHTGRDIRDGFYTVFHFTLDPGGVRDIERDLKLNDQVMRFLITHYTPKPVVPGAAPEGGEQATVDGEPTTTTDAAAPDSSAPAEVAAATDSAAEPASETVDATAPDASADTTTDSEVEVEASATEVVEPVEADVEVIAPDEPGDAEPTSATSESVESTEEALADEATVEEVAVEEPVADEPAIDEPANNETPAEPTAPAKDDEEA